MLFVKGANVTLAPSSPGKFCKLSQINIDLEAKIRVFTGGLGHLPDCGKSIEAIKYSESS